MHHQHLEAGAAAGRRARMQEDPAIGMGLLPASSNRMGSHITSDCCAQRSCSEKLYALRTGRHGGERETAPQPAMSQHRAIGRLLRIPRYRFVMVNRIEFSAEPTDTYLMNVQYVSSFIAQVAFA